MFLLNSAFCVIAEFLGKSSKSSKCIQLKKSARNRMIFRLRCSKTLTSHGRLSYFVCFRSFFCHRKISRFFFVLVAFTIREFVQTTTFIIVRFVLMFLGKNTSPSLFSYPRYRSVIFPWRKTQYPGDLSGKPIKLPSFVSAADSRPGWYFSFFASSLSFLI